MVQTALTTLVGTPSSTVWTQAQSFQTDSLVQVGVVLSLKKKSGDDVLELPAIGGAMLLSMRESAERPLTLLQLKQVVTELSQGLGEEMEISVAIVRVVNGYLSIAGTGEVVGYMVRRGQLVKLGMGKEFALGVSGKLMAGDAFCVSTEEMVERVGLSSLLAVLSEPGPAEQLAPIIHKEQDSSLVGAILGSYGTKEEEGGTPRAIVERIREVWKTPLRVRRNETEPKRINMAVAGLALVFLIVMIGFGYVRRAKLTAGREYESVQSLVGQNLREAESVADLNPERARSLMSQAKQAAEEYSTKSLKEPYRTKAGELVLQVTKAEKEIFKVDSAELSPFVELSVLSDGLTAERMYLDPSGTLVFPDTRKPRVVGINIEDKSKITIETGAVGTVSTLGFFDKVYYGVSSKGVVQLSTKEAAEVVIEPDPLWGEITQIESYAGNIYLLDKGNSEIWKYPVVTDGFGERKRWLAAGISLDLTKVSALRVTGDIWFTTTSGKLERYSRGVPVEFTMEGFPASAGDGRLSDPAGLFVTDEEVYVLERGAKRVVVFDQDGKYQAQYVSEELAEARDIAIYKDRGFVLLNGVVKEFGL